MRFFLLLAISALTAQSFAFGENAPACTGQEHSWRDVLRCHKSLDIQKGTHYFNRDALIRQILKDPAIDRLGYELINSTSTRRDESVGTRFPSSESGPKYAKRDAASPLTIRVGRKRLTTRYTVSLIEPASDRVLISDSASSLGGEIEPDLAKIVVKWIREANHDLPETKQK